MSIGKAHETTNQEVQECSLKPPVSDSTNAVFKHKPDKGLMCNYCASKKGSQLKLIELLRENIATLDSGKPNIPSSASELHTPLTMATILSKYPDVFDDSVNLYMYNYKFLILSSIFVFFPPFFSSTRIVLIKVVSVGKLEGELHLYTKQDVTPLKAAPSEIALSNYCQSQRSPRTRYY